MPQLTVAKPQPLGTIGTYQRPTPPTTPGRRELRRGRAGQGRQVEQLLTKQAEEQQEKRRDARAQLLEKLRVRQPSQAVNAPQTSIFQSMAATSNLLATVAAANSIADGRAAAAGVGGNNAKGVRGIVKLAASQLGADYVWADLNPIGPKGGPGGSFDCSGFTKWLYQRAYGMNLPHMASMQQQVLGKVSRENLQVGDLVFFAIPGSNWKGPNTASHVGVYIGNGMMIDASSSNNAIVRRPVFWNYFLHGGRRR